MRVKREYLTDTLPDPLIVEKVVEKVVNRVVEKPVVDPDVTRRLASIESIAARLLEYETEPEEPEDPGPTIADVMRRLDRLEAALTSLASRPAPSPAPKQSYEFNVVRNAAGDIERVVARPAAKGVGIYERVN